MNARTPSASGVQPAALLSKFLGATVSVVPGQRQRFPAFAARGDLLRVGHRHEPAGDPCR
jgi:hypothetical protein